MRLDGIGKGNDGDMDGERDFEQRVRGYITEICESIAVGNTRCFLWNG